MSRPYLAVSLRRTPQNTHPFVRESIFWNVSRLLSRMVRISLPLSRSFIMYITSHGQNRTTLSPSVWYDMIGQRVWSHPRCSVLKPAKNLREWQEQYSRDTRCGRRRLCYTTTKKSLVGRATYIHSRAGDVAGNEPGDSSLPKHELLLRCQAEMSRRNRHRYIRK